MPTLISRKWVALPLVLGCIIAVSASVSAAKMTVAELRCAWRENPLGVDQSQPSLAWIVESGARNARQTAYQIMAASSMSMLMQDRGDLWDSGKVVSNSTTEIEYAGQRLSCAQQVFWKVRSWDGQDQPTAWSEPARWTMGTLDPADWSGAKWIGAPLKSEPNGKPGPARQPASLLLRSDFQVKPGLRRGVAFVCGLGCCEMSVNGKKVTDDVLSPGWSKYNKTCLYETYDITTLLNQGGNAVGLFLGNGMYNVKKTDERYVKFEGSFGPLKAIAQLRLEYEDGTTEVITTNQDWKAAAAPVTFDSVYGGEDYDARLFQARWDQPGFTTGSNWSAAAILPGPGGELKGLSCSAPPIRKYDLFKPVKTMTVKPGVTVYDFGQNAAQMMSISVEGPAGSSVRIFPSELVKADGSADQQSTGTPIYCVYTLAGTGRESWSPPFFYSGYRYLQVEQLPAPGDSRLPIVDRIESNAVHSASPPIGDFTCSNELFNRTYKMVRWAQMSNMVSVLTDCPHRERLGWLEQIHLNGPALRYNFDLNAFFNKTMNDMADSQLDDGLIPSVAPDYVLWGSGDFYDSPEWGSAFVLVAWQQYQFTGSTATLGRYYDRMARYVEHLRTRSKNDIVNYGLSDWYDIGPGEPGYSKLTPKGITATAFYYQDTLILAQSAKLLGKLEDAAKYTERATHIRQSFNTRFFNRSTGQYGTGSQAANSIALVMGLAEQDNRLVILNNIVRDVREKGLTAGDIGYRYLLSALAAGGHSDVLYEMNNQSTKPGYGMQLASGATSLPEAWDAHRSSSQNHFMLGQINEWFFQNLAGIGVDPSEPGFQKIVISPSVVGDLSSVKASYHSVHGLIAVQWNRDGNSFKLHVTIPANARATVRVPAGGQTDEKELAKLAAGGDGVRFDRMDNHSAVYETGSGSYDFSSRLSD